MSRYIPPIPLVSLALNLDLPPSASCFSINPPQNIKIMKSPAQLPQNSKNLKETLAPSNSHSRSISDPLAQDLIQDTDPDSIMSNGFYNRIEHRATCKELLPELFSPISKESRCLVRLTNGLSAEYKRPPKPVWKVGGIEDMIIIFSKALDLNMLLSCTIEHVVKGIN
ncbi:hypothetical protein LXL04_005448 [Taraxacum kok-saghyz]